MGKCALASLLTFFLQISPVAAQTSSAPTSISQTTTQTTLEQRILIEAKSAQVIMFGEEHLEPYDNQYVGSLLPKLKKLGYDYFAFEFPKDWRISNYLTGKNTKGDILRYFEKFPGIIDAIGLFDTAKENKMKIVFYDNLADFWVPMLQGYSLTDDSPIHNERDKKSFAYLYETIFKREKNAKVVVYCGAQHLSEQSYLSQRQTDVMWIELGHHLNIFTQERCLTVNLTPHFFPYVDISANGNDVNEIYTVRSK